MLFQLLVLFAAFCAGVYFNDAPWVKSGKSSVRNFIKKATR
jgi:hypothetical protein